jgi:hypothetical protein
MTTTVVVLSEKLHWQRSGRWRKHSFLQVNSNPQCHNNPMPLPAFETMPLAVLGQPFDHRDWLFELKYDGYRALAYGEWAGASDLSQAEYVQDIRRFVRRNRLNA